MADVESSVVEPDVGFDAGAAVGEGAVEGEGAPVVVVAVDAFLWRVWSGEGGSWGGGPWEKIVLLVRSPWSDRWGSCTACFLNRKGLFAGLKRHQARLRKRLTRGTETLQQMRASF